MRTQIWKEIRGVGLISLLTIVGGIVFLFLPGADEPALAIAGWWTLLGAVIVSSAVFGNEFQPRTIGALLSSPISRKRIWVQKMAVSGTLVCFVTWCAGTRISRMSEGSQAELWPVVFGILLFSLCAAPIFSLWTQSTLSGALMAGGAPLAVLSAISGVWAWLNNEINVVWVNAIFMGCIVLLSGIFGVAGFLRFKNFQDFGAAGLAPDVSFGLNRFFERFRTPFRGPISALLWKEIRLHQTSVGAGLGMTVFLFAGVLAIWRSQTRDAEGLLLAALLVQTVTMTLLIAAIGFCHEKALGVFEWNRTVPASSVRQFGLKLSIILLLIVIFVGLVSLLAIFITPQWLDIKTITIEPAILIAYFCLLAGVVYVAAACSTPIRAIGFGVIFVVAAPLAYLAAQEHFKHHWPVTAWVESPASLPSLGLLNSLLWPWKYVVVPIVLCSAFLYGAYRLSNPTATRTRLLLKHAVVGVFLMIFLTVSSATLEFFQELKEQEPSPAESVPSAVQDSGETVRVAHR
jgi:hypothetical protein